MAMKVGTRVTSAASGEAGVIEVVFGNRIVEVLWEDGKYQLIHTSKLLYEKAKGGKTNGD